MQKKVLTRFGPSLIVAAMNGNGQAKAGNTRKAGSMKTRSRFFSRADRMDVGGAIDAATLAAMDDAAAGEAPEDFERIQEAAAIKAEGEIVVRGVDYLGGGDQGAIPPAASGPANAGEGEDTPPAAGIDPGANAAPSGPACGAFLTADDARIAGKLHDRLERTLSDVRGLADRKTGPFGDRPEIMEAIVQAANRDKVLPALAEVATMFDGGDRRAAGRIGDEFLKADPLCAKTTELKPGEAADPQFDSGVRVFRSTPSRVSVQIRTKGGIDAFGRGKPRRMISTIDLDRDAIGILIEWLEDAATTLQD